DATPVPYAELPVDQRVARLRADLDAARHRAAQLWSAYVAGQAKAQQAAAPMLHALRRNADTQNSYRIAATEAHHRWVSAEHNATAAEHAYASAQNDAAAARSDGDDLTALSSELHATLLGMEAEGTRAEADTARSNAERT